MTSQDFSRYHFAFSFPRVITPIFHGRKNGELLGIYLTSTSGGRETGTYHLQALEMLDRMSLNGDDILFHNITSDCWAMFSVTNGQRPVDPRPLISCLLGELCVWEDPGVSTPHTWLRSSSGFLPMTISIRIYKTKSR